MAQRKLKPAARGRSGVEGKKRETVVRSVPVLKTNDENGGDEILGSRTRMDRRTSPRIHSQFVLDGDLKFPQEDIVPVNSGGHLAVHQNATTKTASKNGVDVEVGVGGRGKSKSSSESDDSGKDSNESEKASLPAGAKLGEIRNLNRSFQRENIC